MANPATILLVEDDRTLLDGIADLLEISNLGYDLKILKAADGEEALQVLSQRPVGSHNLGHHDAQDRGIRVITALARDARVGADSGHISDRQRRQGGYS